MLFARSLTRAARLPLSAGREVLVRRERDWGFGGDNTWVEDHCNGIEERWRREEEEA